MCIIYFAILSKYISTEQYFNTENYQVPGQRLLANYHLCVLFKFYITYRFQILNIHLAFLSLAFANVLWII